MQTYTRVLDAVGKLPAGHKFDGKSLLPLIAGSTKTHHETLFWNTGAEQWAVRGGDWKLRSVKGKLELFNLAKDPSEMRNLVSSQSAVVKKLSQDYDTWIKQMAKPITSAKRRK